MKNNNSILWILGLVVVVVVVIVVLVLVFRKKKSGGGGGGGTKPQIKSYSFAAVDPAKSSPWLIQTSYVVAYVDTTYTAINHGPISNVVTVSSKTGTNPTFIVTAKAGYDVVVYRTAATDENTAPTPPTGKETLFTTVKDGKSTFTDNLNPYTGPPPGPTINSTIVWDTTKKKTPYRVTTYYQLALSPVSDQTDIGGPGPVIAVQNPLGYDPTMTFPDNTSGGTVYKTNVYRSSDQKTWTLATDIAVTYSNGIGSFMDTANTYYTGPPAILASNFILATPPSVTCDSAPATMPWGLTTIYNAAFSDYPDSPTSCGKMLEIPITFKPQTGCPIFTITQPTSDPYYIVIYRTDNGNDPTNLPPPPTTANAILPPYVSGPSWTDNNNPFKGVPQVSFGSPVYNTISKDTLPFRVSTSVIVTLTDTTNKLVGLPTTVDFSNPMGTVPVTVKISLPSGYFWKVYTMKVQRSETTGGTPIDVLTGEVTFDTPITTMKLNKNPYYTAPPAYSPADFHCNIWENKNTCSNTCSPACTDPTKCCTNNQCTSIATYDPKNTGNFKNADGTCVGRQLVGLDTSTITSACDSDPTNNPYFVVSGTTHNVQAHIDGNFTGYCAAECPDRWNKGIVDPPDSSKNVCSPEDPASPSGALFGYGYGCLLDYTKFKPNGYCRTVLDPNTKNYTYDNTTPCTNYIDFVYTTEDGKDEPYKICL